MRILAVRLDSMGDVLLTGPAIRALSADGSLVTLLAGPRGRQAADLLPGVGEIETAVDEEHVVRAEIRGGRRIDQRA